MKRSRKHGRTRGTANRGLQPTILTNEVINVISRRMICTCIVEEPCLCLASAHPEHHHPAQTVFPTDHWRVSTDHRRVSTDQQPRGSYCPIPRGSYCPIPPCFLLPNTVAYLTELFRLSLPAPQSKPPHVRRAIGAHTSQATASQVLDAWPHRCSTDSRTNAHTSPTAQYTLVSISGRNSIPAPTVGSTSLLAQCSPAAHAARATGKKSGKRATKSWRRTKPARYHRSSMSRMTNGSVFGNLWKRGVRNECGWEMRKRRCLLVYAFVERLHHGEYPEEGVDEFDEGFWAVDVSGDLTEGKRGRTSRSEQ